MDQPFTAKIFLSDNRCVRESNLSRSYSTLSSGDEQNTHTNFSGLFVLDDDELAGSGSIEFKSAGGCYLLLLPVTGDLLIVRDQGIEERINVGELKIIGLTAATAVKLINPYPEDHISFLRIMINKTIDNSPPYTSLSEFDLWKHENQLLQISPAGLPFKISLGRFKGRKDYTYSLNYHQNKIFSFVIAGAFELENRLLQIRDGLALTGVTAVTLEALSEGAILLTIELP